MPIKLSVEKNKLLDALNSLQNITNKKATLAILGNVYIEADNRGIFLTGTDLEVGARYFVEADVQEEGKITLPSKKLFEIIRESGSEAISIEENDNYWVVIQSGNSTYNLAGISGDEFPEFPDYSDNTFVSIDSSILLDLIDKTIFSIANEQENIYSLTSVLFEKEAREESSILKMISSDGHRLSIMEKEAAAIDKLEIDEKTLIPKKGVSELRKFCESKDSIEISFHNNQMVTKADEAVLVVRLKQGEFPNYKTITDSIKLDNRVEIKRIPFLESLKRINLFTEDIFHSIQLYIDENLMILTSESSEVGNARDEQSVQYDGAKLNLAFNCRYFIDTLQVMSSENIYLYINSNNSPCLIKSDTDEGFTSIIMPMQV